MDRRLAAKIGGVEVEVVLLKTKQSDTLWDALPISSVAHRWGEEVYFDIPIPLPRNGETLEVEEGDFCYWPEGQSIAIFFGPTPISTNKKPVPYSAVIKLGKLASDPKLLRKTGDGDLVTLEKIC